jgi:hypothetical protein
MWLQPSLDLPYSSRPYISPRAIRFSAILSLRYWHGLLVTRWSRWASLISAFPARRFIQRKSQRERLRKLLTCV